MRMASRRATRRSAHRSCSPPERNSNSNSSQDDLQYHSSVGFLRNRRRGTCGAEDCHLIPLRRSKRLTKKGHDSLTESSYFSQVVYEHKKRKVVKETLSQPEPFVSPFLGFGSSEDSLNGKLREAISGRVFSTTFKNCSKGLLRELTRINSILSGDSVPQSPIDMEMRRSFEEDETNVDIDLVPKSKWIYETPPRQRIQTAKAEKRLYEPAVLCTTMKERSLFRFAEEASVDLNGFQTGQLINVDDRYLKPLAQFNFDQTSQDFPLHQNEQVNLHCFKKKLSYDQCIEEEPTFSLFQPELKDLDDNMNITEYNFQTKRARFESDLGRNIFDFSQEMD